MTSAPKRRPGQTNAADVSVLLGQESLSLAELMSVWRSRDVDQWKNSPQLHCALGKRILAEGEPLLAYDIIADGLARSPAHLGLRQLQGLALARSGATARANRLLETLRSEGQTDEETLGMLGRTYKDLASQAAPTERDELRKRAATIYAEAYQATGGYWTGINAATMYLITGEKDVACKIAHAVRNQCLKEVEDPAGDQYWELAVLGEAALICGDFDDAEKWYKRAAIAGAKRFGDLNSSRRNARLILEYWKKDASWIDRHLRVPGVIVFAGHMIDQPDRATPRFPQRLESAVAAEIRARIDKIKPGIGYASAACGSDILFLEAMLEIGAEIFVILPYNQNQFVRDSVDFTGGSTWRARFDRVLERAADVLVVSTHRLEIGGVAYEFCNQMLLGLATIRARQLDTDLIPLAVWNRMAGDGPGGAATVVQEWQAVGYEPEIIDLEKIRLTSEPGQQPDHVSAGGPSVRVAQEGPDAFVSRIVALLFADAVGFSKLTEAEVPHFVRHFLGAIARLSAQFSNSILAKNTWGDGLYFVFSDVEAAGKFGLDLAEVVRTTKWEEKQLRTGLNLRIGLHAGPVYEFDDPITGNRSYSGTHVSRAARIEPITPPGQVYASEAFAALAAAHRVKYFSCDYVGQTPMAKDYGTLPTYHVRPRAHMSASL